MTAFLQQYGMRILTASATHLFYVVVSVLVGFVVALALGMILSNYPNRARVIIPVLSLLQTVPGIVFIGILFLYLGMIPATVIIALSVYAVFPVLKNTYTGLAEVPREVVEAARGCGMTRFQALVRVKLPMALPSIISGLRMSTIYTVSWAVLAAMIGLGGLGELIYTGIASNNNALIFAGAIPAAAMALLLSLGIDLLRKRLIPPALRQEKS